VLLKVARETIGFVKSLKKKKWISNETFDAIRVKREAKGKDKHILRIEGKEKESSEWINSSSWKACAWNWKHQIKSELFEIVTSMTQKF